MASVIIGATSLKQLEDNMGAGSGWELSKDEVNTPFLSYLCADLESFQRGSPPLTTFFSSFLVDEGR